MDYKNKRKIETEFRLANCECWHEHECNVDVGIRDVREREKESRPAPVALTTSQWPTTMFQFDSWNRINGLISYVFG